MARTQCVTFSSGFPEKEMGFRAHIPKLLRPKSGITGSGTGACNGGSAGQSTEPCCRLPHAPQGAKPGALLLGKSCAYGTGKAVWAELLWCADCSGSGGGRCNDKGR